MSSSYLWEDHREDIIALYNEGLSIPVIHKRIRSDVFKISERVLYDQLKKWGLETDAATRRQRAARAKTIREQKQNLTAESWTPSIFPTEEGSLEFPYDSSFTPNPFHPISNQQAQNRMLVSEAPFRNFNLDPCPMLVQQAGSCVPSTVLASNDLLAAADYEANDSQWWDLAQKDRMRWSADNVRQENGLPRSSGISRGLRRQSSASSNRGGKASSMAMTSVKAIAASYNHLLGIDHRSSLVSTDSGYAGSSRSSLSVTNPPRSSQAGTPDVEFASLYKVVCTESHHPTRMYPFTSNPPRCGHCGFSEIHRLSWQANRLPVEEFIRRIETFSETKNSIDKAGNTSLHYAAAGGAGFDHLFALMEFGVILNQRNTRGQIFLHMIEPKILDFDLFNLLNIPDVRNLRDCRDYFGQTVLHELCRKADTHIRRKSILRYFESEGLPSGPLDCYGQSAESACMQDASIEKQNTTASWESKQLQIEQDHEVVRQAESDPNYKHPETGSNIIHVLSRLQLEPNDRLNRLLKYLCRGVSQNYNRDGELPLISFAGQRPENELKVDTELFIASILDALKDRGSVEVHMRNRRGETALHSACINGSHFSVKLLIERGSNVNSRTFRNESILRATLNSRAMESNNQVKLDNFKEVLALLERHGAVQHPTSLQERGMQSVADQMAHLSMT